MAKNRLRNGKKRSKQSRCAYLSSNVLLTGSVAGQAMLINVLQYYVLLDTSDLWMDGYPFTKKRTSVAGARESAMGFAKRRF